MSLPRTPAQAVALALSYAARGTGISVGMCDHYVGAWYGLAHSGFATAYVHASAVPSQFRHAWSLNPPSGALLFWRGGSRGAGHVAISVGGGRIASTDYPRSGRVGVTAVNSIATQWGLTPLFWTDPWFGSQGSVVLPHAAPVPPAVRPLLHLALLKPGLSNADVRTYQAALRRRNGLSKYNPSGATGYYGSETIAMTEHAYRDVLRLTGGDLTTPGPKLLTWLGYRAG